MVSEKLIWYLIFYFSLNVFILIIYSRLNIICIKYLKTNKKRQNVPLYGAGADLHTRFG